MKLVRFSFKREAIWLLIFGLSIPLIGILIYLVILLYRWLMY